MSCRPTSIVHRSSFIACCSLLLLAACSPPGANVVPTFVPPPAYGPAPDSVHTVARGRIVETIEARGRVVAEREAHLTFPVGGTLKAIYIAPGDPVEQGALLAELDAPAAKQNVLMAQLDLRLAEAELMIVELQSEQGGPPRGASPFALEELAAQIALERAEAALDYALEEYDKALGRFWNPPEVAEAYAWELHLREQDYQLAEARLAQVYAQERARAQTEVYARQSLSMTQATQRLQVAMAEMRVEKTRFLEARATEQLSNTLLAAPLSGVVVSIEKRPGDQVGAYETIGVVADPSRLWVVATVLEQDVDRVNVGQPVTVRLDIYPDKTYTGTILQIVSQATVWQGNSGYEVTVAFDEGQDVPAIMRMGADVSIAGRSRENVPLAPSRAILTIGGREYVEVVGEDGDIERVEIHTGITNGTETEIVDGLQVGQKIRIP
ncbi:MAG: efflux RND transporter periplasmic adaptor subunit [Anaerolineae bacterium]